MCVLVTLVSVFLKELIAHLIVPKGGDCVSELFQKEVIVVEGRGAETVKVERDQ